MCAETMNSTQLLTTAPIAAHPGDPEFLDAAGVETRFSIKRALLWRLLAEGRVRGVVIRTPGRIRGKRLFDVSSIRALLQEHVGPTGWNPKAIARDRKRAKQGADV